MQKIIDARLQYKGFSSCECVCHIRVYEAPNHPTVVILTELPNNRGTSVTNMVGPLASEVFTLLEKPARGVLWIEHSLYPAGFEGRYRETFDAVTFTCAEDHFFNPAWSSMTPAAVEALIGHSIEPVPI